MDTVVVLVGAAQLLKCFPCWLVAQRQAPHIHVRKRWRSIPYYTLTCRDAWEWPRDWWALANCRQTAPLRLRGQTGRCCSAAQQRAQVGSCTEWGAGGSERR